MRGFPVKHLWLRAVIVALAIAMAGCSGSAASGNKQSSAGPVKLGLTTALTGAYSEFGVPMKNGIDLAIKEFNDSGACPRKIQLVSYDDQLVAETAQANMHRLLSEDKVDFVMSPAGSGPTLAVLPLVNAAHKIMMNTIAQTSTIVTPKGQAKPYPNVFSFSLGNDVEAQFMGEFVLGRKYKTVGLIAESTPYGATGLDQIERVLKEKGTTKVVAREAYDEKAPDVTAQLARLKQANPDAILMVGLGNDTATIRQGMARLGMLNTPFLISNGAGTIPYAARAKELVEGTMVVQYAAFGGGEPGLQSAKDFAAMYKKAYGNDLYYGNGEWPVPSFGGTPASAYDGAKVLLEAFKRAGCSIDTAKVEQALDSGGFVGARGAYKFSATQHTAVTTKLLVALVYRVGANGAITYGPAAR